MKKLAKIKDNIVAMSSSELLELLHFESKSSLNRAIRAMFEGKIATSAISALVESSGMNKGKVSEYYLPELESKMFVAKHDIDYLEQITQFWIGRNKSASNHLTQEFAKGLSRLEYIAKRDRSRIENIAKKKVTEIKEETQIQAKRLDSMIINQGLDDQYSVGQREYMRPSIPNINRRIKKLEALVKSQSEYIEALKDKQFNLAQDLEAVYEKLKMKFDIHEYDI